MAKRTIPGINIQWPWSQLLLSGEKTVETRGYDISEKYRGVELALIETPGPRGKKEAGIERSRIIGTIVFEKTYRYQSKKHWQSEERLHHVPTKDPQYAWSNRDEKWGWKVKSIKALKKPMPSPKKKGIVYAISCKL